LPAVEALAVWGGSEFVPESSADAEFRTRWMILPIEAMLTDARPDEPRVSISIRTGDEPLAVSIGAGRIDATTGEADEPQLEIVGPPKPVLGVVAGKIPVTAAAQFGIEITGDPTVLERVGLH